MNVQAMPVLEALDTQHHPGVSKFPGIFRFTERKPYFLNLSSCMDLVLEAIVFLSSSILHQADILTASGILGKLAEHFRNITYGTHLV